MKPKEKDLLGIVDWLDKELLALDEQKSVLRFDADAAQLDILLLFGVRSSHRVIFL